MKVRDVLLHKILLKGNSITKQINVTKLLLIHHCARLLLIITPSIVIPFPQFFFSLCYVISLLNIGSRLRIDNTNRPMKRYNSNSSEIFEYEPDCVGRQM